MLSQLFGGQRRKHGRHGHHGGFEIDDLFESGENDGGSFLADVFGDD